MTRFPKFLTLFLCCMLAVCVAFAGISDAEAAKKKTRAAKRAAPQSQGVNDPRYAAIILNPVTGEIYHQQNADAKRYPASLTKMMTLYLLFEALEKNKISMGTDMDVSALAARQPRTNLSLREGDEIDVETAIKSLIVLSANDVSVVVAEKLGGDVDSFAEMMTSKARALGMRNTVFRNANGLPNTAQYTTARDMAKLGIALKRDFPKYYRYFSTLQFSHNGATYYTHNRVMLRYAGVDGIKTGYIGMSGFNLVTSVVRGGRPLVGVVMGGSTGRWRDNRMIELLDQSYQTISSRGAVKGRSSPENLPTMNTGGAKKSVGIDGTVAAAETVLDVSAIPAEAREVEDGGANDTLPPATIPSDPNDIRVTSNSVFDAAATSASPSKAKVITVTSPPAAENVAPAQYAPAPKAEMPIPTAPQELPSAVVRPPEKGFEWGIQVGAFSSASLADQAVTKAQQAAARQLVGADVAVLGPESGAPKQVYRARLVHLSQTQAKNACQVLIQNKMPCLVFQSGK